MTIAQRLVTKGHLHPAHTITRCSSLIRMGGPAIYGLIQRPYFCLPHGHAFMSPQTRGKLRAHLVSQNGNA